jgi:E3 Ubiquitin ligase
MVQIALVLIALGLVALVVGFMERLKAGRVADAPLVKTGDAAAQGPAVANPKGGLSAQGDVLCREPLISPVTGVPCLYYALKVTASWKDGDREKSKELTKEKRAAQFTIDDGSGPVWVDAREGGDFEPSQKKEETKSTSLLGGITGQDLVFGNYRVSTGLLSLGTKYEVVEEVLPVVPRLYACGKTASGGVIAAPGWRSLILSGKSRDELLAGAAKSAKMFLGGGAGAFAVGVALAVVASLTAPPATAAVPATTSATATATAQAPAPTADDTATPAASTPAPSSKPAPKLPTAAPASKAARAPKPKR